MELESEDDVTLFKAQKLARSLYDSFCSGQHNVMRKRYISSIEWFSIFSRKKGKRHFRSVMHIDRQTFYLLTSYLYRNGGEAVEKAKKMKVSFATTIARGVLSMASRGTMESNAIIMKCSKTSYIKSVELFKSMLLHVKSQVIRVPSKTNFRYFKSNAGEIFKGAVLAIGMIVLRFIIV